MKRLATYALSVVILSVLIGGMASSKQSQVNAKPNFAIFQWSDSDGTFKIDTGFNPPRWTITSSAHGDASGTLTIQGIEFAGSGSAQVDGLIFGSSSGICNVQSNSGSYTISQ